ncbi:MAG: GTP 3',8-cyclase MoaA [Actinomycetaceae bacterium]|nr:GTP 3',8-cyclase MoaA [Actinomycetaceae bacterium]
MHAPTAYQYTKPVATSLDAPLALRDSFGRVARDLRMSLTDRCNLRCTYCMPAEGLEWLPGEDILSDSEVKRLIDIGVGLLGIREIRFTGGEPLLRQSLAELLAHAHALRTDEDKPPRLSLTTNALGLDKKAGALVEAGLERVNISLDSLDPQTYARISGRDRLGDVLRGIDAAIAAGLHPIKVNAVAMRGVNEQGLCDLLRFCLNKGLQLRIIEHMPLGPQHTWSRAQILSAEDVLHILGTEFELNKVVNEDDPHAPARIWIIREGANNQAGTVGIIASVSKPFCANCDRTRITADGQMRSCLFARVESDLRGPLRAGASDQEIAEIWAGGMAAKKAGHGIDDPGFVQPTRFMSEIGG